MVSWARVVVKQAKEVTMEALVVAVWCHSGRWWCSVGRPVMV